MLAARPGGAGARVRGRVAHLGRAGRHRRRRSATLVDGRARGSACSCATVRPTSGCCSACCAPARCVVTINPERGPRRGRATTSPRSTWRSIAGDPDDLAGLVPDASRRPRPQRRPSSATPIVVDPPAGDRGRRRRRAAPASPSRCSPAARPARPSGSTLTLRDVRAGAGRRQALRDATATSRVRLRARRGHRELAAGAPRRAVPRAAVRERRPLVLPARALHASTSGSTRCAATARRRSAWCPRRCAWCSRPTSTRPISRSVRSVISGTAPLDPDDADAFIGQVRRPRARHLRGHRVRRRRRRLEPRRPPSSSGRPSGAASAGPMPGASCAWSTRDRRGRSAPDEEGLLEVKAGQLGDGRLDAHHRPGPHRRRRLPVDPRAGRPGHHPRRLQGPARRRPRRARARIPRVRGAAVVGRPTTAARRGAGRRRRAAARARTRRHGRRAARRTRRSVLARYELPTEIRIVDALPRTDSGKVDLAEVHGRGSDARAVEGLKRMAGRSASSRCRRPSRPPRSLRRVTGLAAGARGRGRPDVERLIDDLRAAEASLLDRRAAGDPAPRVGDAAAGDGRVYLDHARDIGAYNPCFPEYDDRASTATARTGSVTFPVAFEGPPGIVHGGLLAAFFDCVVQHHNCDVGRGRQDDLARPALPAADAAADRAVLRASSGPSPRDGSRPRASCARDDDACCARPRSTRSRATARRSPPSRRDGTAP